jgi:DNA-binding LacI/PurR family transcriptional regulator
LFAFDQCASLRLRKNNQRRGGEEAMLAAERRAQILATVDRRGIVRVTDLVAAFGVSDVTVRRDLDALASTGQVRKVRGGATLPTGSSAAGGAATATAHIGVLVPTAADYFRRIVDGIQGALSDEGARLTLSVSDYRPERERALVDNLVRTGVDGLLLVPTIDRQQHWLRELPVPAVLVEREMDDNRLGPASSVRTAHEQGAAAAVDHLHGLGHRRIALITRGDSQAAELIRRGWELQVARLGLDADVPVISGKDVGSWPRWSDADVDTVVRQLREAQVTALLCHNDENAMTIVQHARGLGWSVPDQLSVVAYEDEVARLGDPPLTAVSPPKEEVGRLAARTLLELIGEPAAARHIRIEPRIIVRHSTARPVR